MRPFGAVNKTLRWRVIEYNDERKSPEHIKEVKKFTTLSCINKEYPLLTPDRCKDFIRYRTRGVKCGIAYTTWKFFAVEKLDKNGN